jgi:hypothetical protein
MNANTPNSQPELMGYSTLIGTTYSSVELEEIPIVPPADAQWRIRFDGGAPIDGHLIDVVLNDTAAKVARKSAKKARQKIRRTVRRNKDQTTQEQDAEIKEIEESFVDRYTPAEKNEAYRQSIGVGNRPPHKDLADLPDWVQQEILQRQSSSTDDLQHNADPLTGNDNTNEASAEVTSTTAIETGDDQPGPLPGNENTDKAGVDDTSPTMIEAAVSPPQPLHGNNLQTEANVDDTSSVVVEAAVGQSGLLPSDEIESEANVDNTSATTEVEAVAVRSGLHLGKEIETEPEVDDTNSKQVDPDADGQSGLHPGGETETELSVDDTNAATETEPVFGRSEILSGKEIETKLSFDDTSSREIEPDADLSELQPSHVKGSTGTMKQPVTVTEQPVTVTDSQLQMPQAFIEQANLDRQAEEQLRHRVQQLYQQQSSFQLSSPHNPSSEQPSTQQPSTQQPSTQQPFTQQPSAYQPSTQQPSTQQPPQSTQQSSSTQATAANIPATTAGLSYEEKHSLVFHGTGGPTSHEALRSKMAQPNILQVDGIQDMIAEFCTKKIWQRYCRLPPASDATPEFKAITSNSYSDRGVRAPTHPIPASFLERLMRELNRLFEVCRPDRRLLILRVIRWEGYEGQDVHALLAEEVRWVRGPEGRWGKVESLGEIGLLLECVGIENQGSSWKG